MKTSIGNAVTPLVVTIGTVTVLVVLVERPHVLGNFIALVKNQILGVFRLAFPGGAGSPAGGMV